MPRNHPDVLRLVPRRALALALTLLTPATAPAATIAVTTSADTDVADADCSLREAIVAANDDAGYNGCPAGDGADRIVFALVLPATIALGDDLPTITSTVAIRGPGSGQLTIDGQDLHRILVLDSVAGGEWLGVEELRLERGFSPGTGGAALVAAGETAWFHRVRFHANRASSGGGALALEASETEAAIVALDECWLSANLALGAVGGGALVVSGALAEVLVDRTTFSGNQATLATGSGGAIRSADGSVSLYRSTLSGNLANDSGGAIFLLGVDVQTTLVVHDTTITANQADADGDNLGDGGGIYATIGAAQTTTVDLANSIVAGNLDSGFLVHPDVSGFNGVTLASSGFNLIGSNEGAALFVAGLPNQDADWVGTAAAPLDPLLEALSSHGGFGPTHRPANDPATLVVDQGSCYSSGSDQRGYGDAAAHTRAYDTPAPNGKASDACDIGAHERGADPQADPALFADDFESGHPLYWDA